MGEGGCNIDGGPRGSIKNSINGIARGGKGCYFGSLIQQNA